MSVSSDLLLHPELLSNGQLLSVLRERQLKIPNLEFMSRDELLELFHQFCLPYSQRKYKDTTRGKLLNKNRNVEATTESFKKLNVFTINNSKSERLKPPLDVCAAHVKRIKLHVEVEKKQFHIESDNFNNNKRKNMNSCLTNEGAPPMKKDRKPITWP